MNRENIDRWVAELNEDGMCDISDKQVEALIRGHAELEQRLAAVVAENAGLNKSLDAICDAYENGQSDLLAEAIRKATSLSTPATDAYLVEALEKTNGELVGYIDSDYADMLKDGDIDKCYLHKECNEGAVPLYLGVALKNG